MQIRESLKISECCSSNSANKSRWKSFGVAVVVAIVQIKESLKISECCSSNSANKRVVENLSVLQ